MEYFSPGVVSFDTLEVRSVCNTPDEVILRNIEVNSGRDLPWVTGEDVKSQGLVIVCGGPSLDGFVPAIRKHQKRGDLILCVNHTAQWLMERRVLPNATVLLDADPQTAECVLPGHMHFIASQCDPCVFDAAGENAILWHSKTEGSEEAVQRGNKHHEGQYASIGGGVTVGQRAVNLGFILGFRSFDIYGMDSSFEGAGHAYEHDWVDADPMFRVEAYGRSFVIEPWMAAQAKFYPYLKELIRSHGGTIRAHGDGLIPWIDKHT